MDVVAFKKLAVVWSRYGDVNPKLTNCVPDDYATAPPKERKEMFYLTTHSR